MTSNQTAAFDGMTGADLSTICIAINNSNSIHSEILHRKDLSTIQKDVSSCQIARLKLLGEKLERNLMRSATWSGVVDFQI